MAITIRELRESDKAEWLLLWRGYQEFYEADLSGDEMRLWSDLMSPGPDGPYAMVAENENNELLGLVQFLFHISTWSPSQRCYLNDLYTIPLARGQGVARKLIEAVYAKSDQRGATQVWWLTQDSNATARQLYDRIGKLTPFVKYVR